jgi:hypothetical protein
VRTRSVKIAVVCTLVGSVFAPLLGQLAGASPSAVAGPPSSPPGQQVDQGIESVDGLGNGGQPEGLPRELVIADARFLFDRLVPLSRQELFRVAQEQETIAYARTEEGPFAAIYLSVPNRSEDELARYLPEGVGSADVACPAEAAEYERVDVSGSLYAFAGVETDLTADLLQQVGDSNGEPVSADPDSTQPFPELFFSSADGLLRFVLVGDDGRPASIAESLAFNGSEFAFESDATDAVDPASLTKVGCSTAFPVFAPTDTVGGGFTQLYVLAGTRLLRFTGAGVVPAEETSPPTTTTSATSTTTTTTTPPPPMTTTTAPPTTGPPATEPATTTSTSTTTSTTTEPPTTTSMSTTTDPATTTSTSTTTTEAPTTNSTSTTTTEPATTTSTSTTSTTTTTEAPTTTSTSTTTTEPATTTSTSTTSTTTTTEAPTTTSTSTTTTEPSDTTTACSGDPGELNAQGVPEHLPTPIQFGGVAYVFVRAEASEDVGTLTRIGCIGPFELASTDQADVDDVLYLRTTGSDADDQVYRFEAAPTFEIEFQVTERPQVVSTGDRRYRVEQVWQPSVYSSTSVILFVQDPADPAPEIIYGLNVSDTVVGDAIGEYRLPDDSPTPEEITAAAEEAGLNPDLTINGLLYVLVDVYTPSGTTRNGFMTLFATTAEETPEVLLGRDQRHDELFIFVVESPPTAS